MSINSLGFLIGCLILSLASQYWLWGPIIAPILGAQSGAFLYDVFLYTEQGVLNPTGGQ